MKQEYARVIKLHRPGVRRFSPTRLDLGGYWWGFFLGALIGAATGAYLTLLQVGGLH